jgi:hypothetical protein
MVISALVSLQGIAESRKAIDTVLELRGKPVLGKGGRRERSGKGGVSSPRSTETKDMEDIMISGRQRGRREGQITAQFERMCGSVGDRYSVAAVPKCRTSVDCVS